MGIYSGNRSASVGSFDVAANENYSFGAGAQQILIENSQNDMNMFNALLQQDFRELTGIKEGTLLESERMILMEVSLGGIWDKIKRGLSIVWEKIKGIFDNFIKRLNTVIIRDNKALVNKYRADYNKRVTSKLKYKMYSNLHEDGRGEAAESITKLCTAESIIKDLTTIIDTSKNNVENINKAIENATEDDRFLNDKLSETIGKITTTASDYAKDAKEYYLGEMEEYEGLTGSLKQSVMKELEGGSKLITETNTIKKKIESAFKSAVSKADRELKNAGKSVSEGYEYLNEKILLPANYAPSPAEVTSKEAEIAHANFVYQTALISQKATTMALNAYLSAIKDSIANYRSVFSKAVAGHIKEDAVFLDMVQEAVEYEVESDFEMFS